VITRFALVLLLFAGVSPAEVVFHGFGVVTQLVDGAGWKTIITMVNLNDTSAPYTLRFYGDDGSPLSLTTSLGSGSAFPGTLPPRGSTAVETAGLNITLSQGYAIVDTPSANIIGGTAVFRRVAVGQPNYEAAEPIDTFVFNRVAFPFDHVTDATGVAIVNVGGTSASISIIFRDEGGVQFLTDIFQMPAFAHAPIPSRRAIL
jgi:hypothetical protein